MKTLIYLLLSLILGSPLFAECTCYDSPQPGIKNTCHFGGCLNCTGPYACCTADNGGQALGTPCSSVPGVLTVLYNCAQTIFTCYSTGGDGSSSSSSSSASNIPVIASCTSQRCGGGLGCCLGGQVCCGGCCAPGTGCSACAATGTNQVQCP